MAQRFQLPARFSEDCAILQTMGNTRGEATPEAFVSVLIATTRLPAALPLVWRHGHLSRMSQVALCPTSLLLPVGFTCLVSCRLFFFLQRARRAASTARSGLSSTPPPPQPKPRRGQPTSNRYLGPVPSLLVVVVMRRFGGGGGCGGCGGGWFFFSF